MGCFLGGVARSVPVRARRARGACFLFFLRVKNATQGKKERERHAQAAQPPLSFRVRRGIMSAWVHFHDFLGILHTCASPLLWVFVRAKRKEGDIMGGDTAVVSRARETPSSREATFIASSSPQPGTGLISSAGCYPGLLGHALNFNVEPQHRVIHHVTSALLRAFDGFEGGLVDG